MLTSMVENIWSMSRGILCNGVFGFMSFLVLNGACGSTSESDGNPVASDHPVGNISTVVGSGESGFSGDGGKATQAKIYAPSGLAVDQEGNIFVSGDNRIRKVNGSTGVITTIAGTGSPGFDGDGGLATKATLDVPEGIAVDFHGNLYVADADNQRIRKIDVLTGIISTIAGGVEITSDMRLAKYTGDGEPATEAYLPRPVDVAVDVNGNIYIADSETHRIRRVDVSSGNITTVAGGVTVTLEQGNQGFIGDGQLATEAVLNNPTGIAIDSLGNIYIADSGNKVVRKVDAITGLISSVARGNAPPAGSSPAAFKVFSAVPKDVSIDSEDNLFIVADVHVYKLNITTGETHTVAGGGSTGLGDVGPATDAELVGPNSVVVKLDGGFLVSELSSNRIREITPPIEK